MSRVVKLEGVQNARDLGSLVGAGQKPIRSGLMFRGGELAKATERDRRRLFEGLGIGCVIDVRCGWERVEKPDVEVPGVENLHIPFYDLDIVGIEYTEPAKGTKTVGRDVACDPQHFYRSLSNPLTVGQMRAGMHALFDHALAGCPVYMHCSGGKDRAGIMSLLALTILGVDREQILDDYLFTNVSRDRHYDEMLERFLRFAGGDQEKARALTDAHRALPANLDAFYESVRERYGSMDVFVREQLGFDDALLGDVRRFCLEG